MLTQKVKYMEIVGYNKDEIFSGHLKEATITCSYEELKEIAGFINNIFEKQDGTDPKCCLHLRDYSKIWEKSSSDLIILIP